MDLFYDISNLLKGAVVRFKGIKWRVIKERVL